MNLQKLYYPGFFTCNRKKKSALVFEMSLVIHLAPFWPRGEAALMILEVNAAIAVIGDIPISDWASGKSQLKPQENLNGETGEEKATQVSRSLWMNIGCLPPGSNHIVLKY